jgi:tetratricopeptide (TPR) repeat protein
LDILLKMKNYLLPTALLGTIALVSYVAPAAALSPVEIQRIARQSTVQITGCDFGSGVIIRKEGNAYTVLTVAHNLRKSGCAVTAPDDAKYQVDRVKTFPNSIDLAVFTFTSNKVYPVAKLIDNSDRVEAMETIYVSGFPLSTAISTSIFTIVKGDIVANPATKQQGKGYSLIYSNNTLPGHSGGPVWNDRGELIAIHGQGDVDTKLQTTMNTEVKIKTGFNLGITVNTFTKLAITAGISGYTPVLVASKPKPIDDLIASAKLKESKGDYQGLFSDMNQAISIDPKNAELYNIRAKGKYYLEDKQGAIDDNSQAIALNPNNDKYYYSRGSIKYYQNNNQGAVEDYTRAIALNPSNDEYYYHRAVSRSSLNNYQGAIEDCTRAIAIDPNDEGYYSFRGVIKSLVKDYKGAIEDSNRALALQPNYSQYYRDRGTYKSESGDNKGAIEDFSRVIAAFPDSGGDYSLRAGAKYTLGDFQGALQDYNRAIALSPPPYSFGESYYGRGNVKSKLGDTRGAIEDFRKASALFKEWVESNNGFEAEYARKYQEAVRAIRRLGGS